MANSCFLLLASAALSTCLEWLIGRANLLIASCYFTIAMLLILGLWRHRRQGVDVMVALIALLFLSCSVGYLADGTVMISVANNLIWQTGLDFIVIVAAIAFLYAYTKRKFCVSSNQINQSHHELESLKNQLEQAVNQREELKRNYQSLESFVTQQNLDLNQQKQRLQEASDELQKMESHLVQTEKMSMLGQMVAGISHEINNPINFISGNLPFIEEHVQDLSKILEVYQSITPVENLEVEAVLEEIELDFILEDLPRLVNSMKLGAERICELVINLRNFYRLDESQMKPADLIKGIESTLILLHNRYKCSIEVIKNLDNIPLVECHINQINQVFMNLISNAIDALLESEPVERKQIFISTSKIDSNRVSISISDNGSGINPEIQERMFEPFFTTKPIGLGTGLGLSICYKIVTETHQGRIYCQSTQGQGTTFTLELPIYQSEEWKPSASGLTDKSKEPVVLN